MTRSDWDKFKTRTLLALPLMAVMVILSIVALLVPELRAWAVTTLDVKQLNSFAVDGATLASDPIANKYGVVLMGQDGTNWHAIKTDSNGLIGFAGWPAASALSDADANPTTTRVGANTLVWDVTNSQWVRVTTRESDLSITQLGANSHFGLDVNGFTRVWGNNSGGWNQLRGVASNADAVASFSGEGSVAASDFLFGYNGSTWDRLRTYAGNGDAITSPTLGLLGSAAYNLIYNGTTWDRMRGDANFNAMVSFGTQLDAVNDSVSMRISNVIPTLDNTSIIAVSLRGKVTTAGDTSIQMIAAGADALTNTVNLAEVLNYNLTLNNAATPTWDRLKTSAVVGHYTIPVAGGATNVSATTTSACSANLTAPGHYIVQTTATVACRQASSSGSTAVTTDMPFFNPNIYKLEVSSSSDQQLCCITAAGTATVAIAKVTYP